MYVINIAYRKNFTNSDFYLKHTANPGLNKTVPDLK